MNTRKHIPKRVKAKVLSDCRRRCCLCVYLGGIDSERPGQIAHIDRDPSNNDASNLVWLCLEHHNRYDSRTSQTMGITQLEIIEYKNKLIDRYRTNATNTPVQLSHALRVRATALRKQNQLFVRFDIENKGPHSARIVGWYFWTIGESAPKWALRAILPQPKVLGAREVHTFVASIEVGEPRQVTRLGIQDSDGFTWDVHDADLAMFQYSLAHEKHIAHLRPSASLREAPQDVTDQLLQISFHPQQSHQIGRTVLCAKIANKGMVSFPILDAKIQWEYKPFRRTSPDGYEPVCYNTGGSVCFSSLSRESWVAPGETVELVLEDDMSSMLIDAAAADVDRTRLQFIMITAQKGTWVCTEEGLPETIEKVVRDFLAGGADRVPPPAAS